MPSRAKLIGNLVHRVAVRLPYKSGLKLEAVEQDPIVKQTVAAIIELSKFKLATVANTLGFVLEGISKTHQIFEKNVPVDVMQSKLFVLRVLSACMQHHWQFYKEQQKQSRINPPALDEALVSFILVLMSRYITQYHLIEETNSNLPINAVVLDSDSGYSYDQIKLSLLTDIYKASSKIIYYVSASNWSSCYSKIKAAVLSLDTVNGNSEEIPPEIRMLECSCLTKDKISTIFSELTPYFLHMRPQGKLLFSKMMRKAIWKWVDSYPDQFAEVYASNARLLPGSEVLFDMCSSAADTPKKKAVLWPLQTMLLTLSPDFLTQAFLDNSPNLNRRSNFFNQLRKSLTTTKSADIAAVCYVDICKAAAVVPPDTESVLRLIAADVEVELREKVWDFEKLAFTDNYNIDQQALLTDFLLYRFRLYSKDTLENLIPSCVEENVPIVFKSAFIKACLALAQNEHPLPWDVPLTSMYSQLGPLIQKVFLQTIQIDMEKPSRKDYTYSTHSSRVDLLHDALLLFRTNCAIGLLHPDLTDFNATLMVGLATLYQHPNQTVRQAAGDLLIKMHKSDTIALWGPTLFHFWKISSQAVFVLARQILENKSNEQNIKSILRLLHQILKTRNKYIKSAQLTSPEDAIMRERMQASVALEIALLVSLASTDKDICDDASLCLAELCQEARLVDLEDGVEPSHISFACNVKVYEDLCQEDTKYVGRKAQQKKIRKHLRMLPNHTPGNMAAWEEAWNRWKKLTQLIRRLSDDIINEELQDQISFTSTSTSSSSNKKAVGPNVLSPKPGRNEKTKTMFRNSKMSDLLEEKSMEWQNYTGFLAALGGCCLANRFDANLEEGSDTRNSDSTRLVDRFIGDMVEMLVSDNLYIREGVKDTLGNDLTPALYAMLFRHLEFRMAQCFDSNGGTIRSPQNKLFVEQSVLVLRLILERLVEQNDHLLSVDFNTLISNFADFLNQLPNTQVTMRIKIQMCILVEIAIQKREHIVIRDEVNLRNRILQITVEWSSDFVMMVEGQQVERYQKDLDLVCLKAVVSLLDNLPLQPITAVRPSEIAGVKSKLFLRYFNHFRKLLLRYRRAEREQSSPVSNRYTKDLSLNTLKASTQSSSENFQDWPILKELTIMAMSHILKANIDAGLKHSLSMGYDEDQGTRAAFIQVLTNILNQGTEFDTLAEDVMTDRYEKLIDMLVEADMEIVMALCEVCPAPDTTGVAEILLVCFESRLKVVPLLRAVIQKEISLTGQEGTLFRGTTMATRILSIFAKNSCLDYVRITLQPAIEEINGLADDDLSCELDPQKLDTSIELNRNKDNVIRATEILLNAICSSVASAPRVFREELAIIREAVSAQFPESKYIAVGGFVFLRLFGPAILTPENANFSKVAIPRNPNVRRLLLQATRVMQNLANNVLFGAKETHMIALNDFLTNNIYKVTNFLRAISTLPTEENVMTSASVRLDQTSYVKLHKYLSDNLERMSRRLTSRRKLHNGGGLAEIQALLGWKKTLDRLSTLLGQLGQPSDLPASELVQTGTSAPISGGMNFYMEFIRRNQNRDLTFVKNLNCFYLGGKSKGGRPVFYIICRLLDTEGLDHELLVFYMMRLMEPYLNKPFEILFDLNEFSTTRCLPIHWMTQVFQLIFSELNDYLVSLYLYNSSFYLPTYISKLHPNIANRLAKRAYICNGLNEIYEYISPSELKLAKQSVDLEWETSVTIFPVTRISSARSSIPVTVKIGPEHVQVISVKKQEMMYNLRGITKDVIHMSDITDLAFSPSTSTTKELSFKFDNGKSTIVLASPKIDLIMKHIMESKQRYESSKPNDVNERAIRPNNVPGRLLNMALINIGSEHPNLRLVAYNLLYSLSISFRFDVGNQLLNARDLCIPSNCINFIVRISESLAKSEPHLTFEFLNEAIVGLSNSTEHVQQLCLDYMAPWLRNLEILAQRSTDDSEDNLAQTKNILRLLIDLTVRKNELYKHIQSRIWKTIGNISGLINILLDCFVRYSVENGIGSIQAEVIADTVVTMSNIMVRGKVISRIRRVIEGTSFQPCRNLIDHNCWNEITVLLRFVLMLSFNQPEPIITHLPEIFHIVSILVATGPTFIRTSVHELVVNTIHALCTTGVRLTDDNAKKLYFVMNDISDSKNRVAFGLTKHHANAFTITKETTSDISEPINLSSLQNIIRLLLEAMTYGAPTTDTANAWKARWMGLVTSTAFYFNPAIQPRSFVTLGCLAQEDVDDDLIYQILVALKGALAIFNESESSLIVSIMMCLGSIIENLPEDSHYLIYLFWLAIALVHIGHPETFQASVQFLQSVLCALDARKAFVYRPMEEVLLDAKYQLGSIGTELGRVAGVNFDEHFSFAVTVILLRGGLKSAEYKETVYQCLTAFLEIGCKQTTERDFIDARTLGYLAGLLPFATKEDTLHELLRLAGINEMDLEDYGMSHIGLFNLLDIPDDDTALLLVSFLVTLLNTSESETEKLSLYSLLADAAKSAPGVFSLVYDPLLPKMNQIVMNSQNQQVIDSVKNILITACSDPNFSTTGRNPKEKLEELAFPSLADPTFGAIKMSISHNAKLASRLLEAITDQP